VPVCVSGRAPRYQQPQRNKDVVTRAPPLRTVPVANRVPRRSDIAADLRILHADAAGLPGPSERYIGYGEARPWTSWSVAWSVRDLVGPELPEFPSSLVLELSSLLFFLFSFFFFPVPRAGSRAGAAD
jgi:hypothetical protein